MRDMKGEDVGVSACSGRNLEDAVFKEGVEVGGNHSFISSLFWHTFFFPWSCPRTHISTLYGSSFLPATFHFPQPVGNCKTGEKRHHLIPEGNAEWSLDGEQGGGSVRKVICDCPGALGTAGCSLRYKQERGCGGCSPCSHLLGALRQLWA